MQKKILVLLKLTHTWREREKVWKKTEKERKMRGEKKERKLEGDMAINENLMLMNTQAVFFPYSLSLCFVFFTILRHLIH